MARAPKRATQKRRAGRIGIVRAYDKPSKADGLRILVDRLWPRGVSKAALKINAWPRELAPSTPLRKWYDHDPDRAVEFRRRYRKELAGRAEDFATLRAMVKGRRATLITATRDIELSHAQVLRGLLER
jgi:uncharacterized protein YeaO (DUF488 family)